MLEALTGSRAWDFATVVVKELFDNALDASETARRPPKIGFSCDKVDGDWVITVSDNGDGIPLEVVRRTVDFSVLVSDKAMYVSPTRGQQGNGLKLAIGIPTALGGTQPVVIEAQGQRHLITPRIDAAGEVTVDWRHEKVRRRQEGTTVTVTVPVRYRWNGSPNLDPEQWRRGFALFNPHARLIEHGQSGTTKHPTSYMPTVPATWRKPLPTDRGSPWWYTGADFARRVTAHNNTFERGEGEDLTIRRFVQDFEGLKMSAKVKAVCDSMTFRAERLSDLVGHKDWIDELLTAMQREARRPKPAEMGKIPAQHYRACFERWYGVEDPANDFWYRRVEKLVDGVPWVAEVAIAATEEPGDLFYGINYSMVGDRDPLESSEMFCHPISNGMIEAYALADFLEEIGAVPDLSDQPCATAVHIITPRAPFMNRGKPAWRSHPSSPTTWLGACISPARRSTPKRSDEPRTPRNSPHPAIGRRLPSPRCCSTNPPRANRISSRSDSPRPAAVATIISRSQPTHCSTRSDRWCSSGTKSMDSSRRSWTRSTSSRTCSSSTNGSTPVFPA
jgi:hypothetical protein